MMSSQRIHEGKLVLDHNRRYCIWEPGRPAFQTLTLTSGCALEIWLYRERIAGHVEDNGLFVATGGKFLLAKRMKARYTERENR